MIKVKFVILLSMLGWFITAFCQELDTFNLLKNANPLPGLLTLSPTQKVELALLDYRTQHGDLNEQEEQFVSEATYFFDRLFCSGRVIFNDPLESYVNQVLDQVLSANPDLETKAVNPKVYILRSKAVNAFAIDQGKIFMSLGLLSILEDEAQLAMVLSHELVHIIEKHSIEGYLKSNEIDLDTSADEEDNRDDSIYRKISDIKNGYSREQEIEADSIGLSIFLNTDYDFSSVTRFFKKLLYSHLPYEDITFDYSTLEKLGTSIPSTFKFPERIDPPSPKDNYNGSHPALMVRIDNTYQRLRKADWGERSKFLLSKERFQDALKRSRRELAQLHLENSEFDQAIYSAFLLEQAYGSSVFTRYVIGSSLYALAKHEYSPLALKRNTLPWNRVEGNTKAVSYLLDRIDEVTLNKLAIVYNYDRFLKDRKVIAEDILIDLIAEMISRNGEINLADLGLEDQNNEAELRAIWNEARMLKKQNDHDGVLELPLAQDKMIVLNPTYISAEEEGNALRFKYQESYERELDMAKTLVRTAEKADFTTILLRNRDLEENDAEILNEILLLDRWLKQQLAAAKFSYHGYEQVSVDAIANKYGARYIAYSFAFDFKVDKKRKGRRRMESHLGLTVFDLQTGRRMKFTSRQGSRPIGKVSMNLYYEAAFDDLLDN